MMVEVFCGILAGAHYSNNIRTWKVTDRVANLVTRLPLSFLSSTIKKKKNPAFKNNKKLTFIFLWA